MFKTTHKASTPRTWPSLPPGSLQTPFPRNPSVRVETAFPGRPLAAQCGTAPVPGGPRGRFRASGLFVMAGAGSAAVSGAGTPVAGPTGRDLFAEGLLEFLRPAVQQLDSHVHAVRESQVELREQIDNLATELCRINEDQKVALDLDPYVKKLLNARRRVVLVNNILQNAQERLRRLNHSVAKETARRRAMLDSGIYPPGSPSK
ncbi:SNARE-associated protein Snapin [Plecturocebus cupreus]